MKVLNMETVMRSFNDYNVLMDELLEAKTELKSIEAKNIDIKYYLNIYDALKIANKNAYGKYDLTIRKLLFDHPEIEDIKNLNYYIGTYLNDIVSLENRDYCKPASQLILLNNDDRKYLVDLRHLEIDDITNLKPELLDFIIKMIKSRGHFIGEANICDLPLLMAIKEDLEKNENTNLYEQRYLMDDSIPYQMKQEFENAKINGKKDYCSSSANLKGNVPFVFNSEEEQRLWAELDDMASNISKEEYDLRYYKLLLLFGNDVENLYLNAESDEIKNYILDAYSYYSSELLDDGVSKDEFKHHFRTLSPIVNIEILKRKMKIKK